MGENEAKVADRVVVEPMAEEKKESSAEPVERIQQIKFTYNRSNYYREIISNGAFGGVTPDLDIHVSFYNQHSPDFKEQLFEVTDKGTLGPEIKTEEPSEIKSIAREIEIGVTMNIPAAIQLARWLTARIGEAAKTAGIEPEEVYNDKPTVSS